MRLNDLTTEAAALSHRIATLRRQRGAAVLVGEQFDDGEINRLQTRLDGLNDARGDAEAAAAAEAQEAHERAVADRRRELHNQIEAQERRRIEAIAAAEAAGQALGAALADSFAAGDQISAALSELNVLDNKGGRFDPPRCITQLNREVVAGSMVALWISTAIGRDTVVGHLGALDLGAALSSIGDRSTSSWAEDEELAMRNELGPLGLADFHDQ